MTTENQAPEGALAQAAEALVRAVQRDWPGAPSHRAVVLAAADKVCAALAAQPQALDYAQRLAVSMWEKHYRADAPNWKPLDELLGVLTQIDNMLTGLVRTPAPAEGYATVDLDADAAGYFEEQEIRDLARTFSTENSYAIGGRWEWSKFTPDQIVALVRAARPNVQPKGTQPVAFVSPAALEWLKSRQTQTNAFIETRLYLRENAEQGATAAVFSSPAPAPGIDVGIPLIEKLMRACTNLGISYEGGYEHFRARFEDNLYAICRGVDSLLASLNQAPAVREPVLWRYRRWVIAEQRSTPWSEMRKDPLQADLPNQDVAPLIEVVPLYAGDPTLKVDGATSYPPVQQTQSHREWLEERYSDLKDGSWGGHP